VPNVPDSLLGIAIAAWIKFRNINYIFTILLFTAISTILFFCHLYALGVYAIFVVGYELGIILYSNSNSLLITIEKLSKSLSQFLLPLILFFIWWHSLPYKGKVEFYSYGNVVTKIFALFSPFAYDFSQVDISIIIFIFTALFILKARYRGGICIYNNMKLPLLFILIAAIAMPSKLSGTFGTDIRYPYIFILLLFLSLKFDKNRENTLSFKKIFLSILLIATCYKSYYLSESWKKINLQYQEFENATQFITQGAKVITIHQESKNLTPHKMLAYDHMPALSIIHRSTFWPLLFTLNNSIYPTAKMEHIDTATGPNLTFDDLVNKKYKNGDFLAINCKVYWEKWEQDFDYLISIRFDNLSTINLKNIKLIFRGSFFDIYQIIH